MGAPGDIPTGGGTYMTLGAASPTTHVTPPKRITGGPSQLLARSAPASGEGPHGDPPPCRGGGTCTEFARAQLQPVSLGGGNASPPAVPWADPGWVKSPCFSLPPEMQISTLTPTPTSPSHKP